MKFKNPNPVTYMYVVRQIFIGAILSSALITESPQYLPTTMVVLGLSLISLIMAKPRLVSTTVSYAIGGTLTTVLSATIFSLLMNLIMWGAPPTQSIALVAATGSFVGTSVAIVSILKKTFPLTKTVGDIALIATLVVFLFYPQAVTVFVAFSTIIFCLTYSSLLYGQEAKKG